MGTLNFNSKLGPSGDTAFFLYIFSQINYCALLAPIEKQEERSTRNKRQVFVHNPIYPYPPLPIVRQPIAGQPAQRVDEPASCVTVQNA